MRKTALSNFSVVSNIFLLTDRWQKISYTSSTHSPVRLGWLCQEVNSQQHSS